jgi:catechol 2,3-dioxygenase-like lactoylglutathione lyase family enzyme
VDEADIGEIMRVIPVIRCKEVKKSLAFYTGVLDFEKKYPEQSDEEWVINLVQGDAEIQLSQHAGDGAFGCAINIRVTDVDGLFKKYLDRGLDTTGHENSPVHRGPVDQTWGLREFYVTDRDGNTLRFGQPI